MHASYLVPLTQWVGVPSRHGLVIVVEYFLRAKLELYVLCVCVCVCVCVFVCVPPYIGLYFLNTKLCSVTTNIRNIISKW
jgi:hypothetical protein